MMKDSQIEDLKKMESEFPNEENEVNPLAAFSTFEAVSMMSTAKGLRTRVLDNINYVQGEIMTGHTYLVDVIKSCRVFQSESALKVLMTLDHQSLRMFVYIVTHLNKDMDRVQIGMAKYMKLAGINSLKTYYTALNDLISKGIIARQKRDMFWINPHLIFNGDRLRKYPDKVDIIKNLKKEA